jgi:hypothetical protein
MGASSAPALEDGLARGSDQVGLVVLPAVLREVAARACQRTGLLPAPCTQHRTLLLLLLRPDSHHNASAMGGGKG